jgi:hypothetical protein
MHPNGYDAQRFLRNAHAQRAEAQRVMDEKASRRLEIQFRLTMIGFALLGVLGLILTPAQAGIGAPLTNPVERVKSTVINTGNLPTTPCATEDSEDCFWDATVRGNGEGRSFWNVDGWLIFDARDIQLPTI